MAGMPGSAGKCSRCLVSANGRRQPRRGTRVSLTTECLRPCLTRNEALQHSAPVLDTRATSRRRTRLIIRSVMSVNSTLPRLVSIRNVRSGVVTSCSSVVCLCRYAQHVLCCLYPASGWFYFFMARSVGGARAARVVGRPQGTRGESHGDSAWKPAAVTSTLPSMTVTSCTRSTANDRRSRQLIMRGRRHPLSGSRREHPPECSSFDGLAVERRRAKCPSPFLRIISVFLGRGSALPRTVALRKPRTDHELHLVKDHDWEHDSTDGVRGEQHARHRYATDQALLRAAQDD